MTVTFGYCVEAPIEWRELLRLAADLDRSSRFAQLWISDALVANGPPDDPRLDAWTALAAIAQATSRIRLGVLVSGNVYRHPAVLAKIATTIDHISNGRLELALGSGWPGENRRFGIPFGARRERLERLEEAVQVIKLLWTQDHPVFEGKHYQLHAPPFSPAPLQKPHPPIHIGGNSPEILRIAARHADAANTGDAGVKAIADICREVGRDPSTIRYSIETPFFMHDDPTTVERAMAWAEDRIPGNTEEIRQQWLIGSPDDVRAVVRRLADAGLSEIVIFQLPRVHAKSLMRFSNEIIPAFQ
jgi:alkanesulfonate monooxygenase SsuD/methylene tetrahydromethanopterin reductase-like flavin-dependent oxidoreductase (luciferase family)